MAPRKQQIQSPPSGYIVSADDAARLQAESPEKYTILKEWFPWQQEVLKCTADEIGMFGGKSSGKAQSLDSMVQTPYGPKPMGSMKVDDEVSNPDGSIARVLGVWPQGRQRIYEVIFSDGTRTRVTGDHRWLIRPTSQKLKAKREWVHDSGAYPSIGAARIYTTNELRLLVNYSLPSAKGVISWSYQVPLTKPVRYKLGGRPPGIDPYVLGVLIGDGSIGGDQVGFTSYDVEIVDEVIERLGHGVSISKANADRRFWRISTTTGVRDSLVRYGLMGSHSQTKFIPEVFLSAAIKTRLDLVCGLMDTDGYVDAKGHASYTTVSPQLAKDFHTLVLGLGCRASVSRGSAGYRNKAGDFVECKDAYTIQFNGPDLVSMVKLPRKRDRIRTDRVQAWKSIVQIGEVEEDEAQCITVDHPNGLYLTDDFITTHNSTVMRGWLVTGNPHLPDYTEDGSPLLINQSYIYHPDYYGLILRKNQKDLEFFLREAQRMWKPLGAEYKNGYFEFPCKSRIDCGHMADENAWTKYIGNEYTRVVIDEAALIPEYGLIEELRSCMRTPHDDLRIQIMYASNCGGKGSGWIIERFMQVKDENGLYIPHGQFIKEKRRHPVTGAEEIKTRVWIFSTVVDNPIMARTSYATDLAYLEDPKRRRAYFEGIWDSFYGQYFELFRPDGPLLSKSEPAHANHVVKKVEESYPVSIKPWHHITMSGDWGYSHESSFLWSRQLPNGQVVIYRELVASQTSPDRLGYEIALQSRADLEGLPSHSFTLFLGHDAFSARQGDKTLAELIAQGIARVLGPHAVHLPDLLMKRLKDAFDQEAYYPGIEDAREKALAEIKLQRRSGITIRKAEKASTIGWQHCRELMRWESIGIMNAQYDPVFAHRLLQEDTKAFEQYCKLYKDIKPEVLPRLQILDCCPRLIDAIPKAQHEDGTEAMDKGHFKGRDSVDSLVYLVTGLLDELPQEPFESYRESRLERVSQDQNLTTMDMIHINRQLEAEWKEKAHAKIKPCTPPRMSMRRRVLARGGDKRGLSKIIDNRLGLP